MGTAVVNSHADRGGGLIQAVFFLSPLATAVATCSMVMSDLILTGSCAGIDAVDRYHGIPSFAKRQTIPVGGI